jgi:C4-dicarboxylate-specific signal transduction histidine kinase
VAVLISSLNSSRRSALATIRRDRERLEELVAARTADLGRTNQQLQQLVHDMGERVKELMALHAISEILEDRTASRADLLARVVRELPPAWQYPEVTEARIIVGSLEVCTERFDQPHR